MLLTIVCVSFSGAQEKQTTSELSYLFPEPKSWDFGVQINQGIVRRSYSNFQGQGGFSETDGISRLALFTQYQITEKSNLKLEVSAGLFNSFSPIASLQFGYQFAPRWTAYAGLGIEYTGNHSFFDGRDDDPKYRDIMYKTKLGVRYQASKSIFIDLRYERDILNRTKLQGLPTSLGKFNTFTLGVGVKF